MFILKGKKFKVIRLDEKKGEFWVKEKIEMSKGKKLRWGLGKDDVSPADLFRLTNGMLLLESRSILRMDISS